MKRIRLILPMTSPVRTVLLIIFEFRGE
jgi:hypothetical protein